jgi:predicted short-subunit dehydrogenase-like oxidoreductase (DUF2520 family)
VTDPRLVVAGGGAVGAALAGALLRAGWPLGPVACRTGERAALRCRALGGGRPLAFAELCAPTTSVGDAGVALVVAVPDREIGAVATALAARGWPDGSIALHVSGAVEVDALAPLARAGLACGGLHPLKSFVDLERDILSWAGTVVAVDGVPAAADLAERIARRLDARPFRLAPGARAAWHAAASHACNHLVALLDQALDLMQHAGLSRDDARAALLPLLAGTLDNLRAHAPAAALTGPIARGDALAVRRHVEALADVPDDVAGAYHALARRAMRLAVEGRGLAPDAVDALRTVLGETHEPPTG